MTARIERDRVLRREFEGGLSALAAEGIGGAARLAAGKGRAVDFGAIQSGGDHR